jgi:membrane protein implicated in regulation of membrane protease activity
MFRRTMAAVRRLRKGSVAPEARRLFARRAGRGVAILPLFGQNAHIIVLGAAGIAGQPLVFFAVAGIGMSAAALCSVVILERAAARLSSDAEQPMKAVEDAPASS